MSAPRARQITTPANHHSVFTGRMPFMPSNRQGQSTEGINVVFVQRLKVQTRYTGACGFRLKYWNKSVFSYTTYADNVALQHSSTAHRAAVRRAAVDRYLLPTGPQQESLLLHAAHAGTDRQDGRPTDA